MPDWKDIYQRHLLPLIRIKNMHQQFVMDLNYDPKNLHISEQYLDLSSGKIKLPKTI